MYDKFQTLAMNAKSAVVILANPEATDFELVPVDASPRELDGLEASGRHLQFLGVTGSIAGTVYTALAAPLDIQRLAALSDAYVRHCETKLSDAIESMRMGDSLEWLNQLYRLEDTRPN